MLNFKLQNLQWIRAHVEFYGNEPSDRMAKEVTRNNKLANQHLFDKIRKSEAIQELTEETTPKWVNEWRESYSK